MTGDVARFLSEDQRRRYGIYDQLREIQTRFGFLPLSELKSLAAKRGLHERDVHSIATFYPHFHMHPPKRAEVAFCDDMSCHLRGAREFRRRIESNFSERERADIHFRSVSCLGRCDAAPAVMLSDQVVDNIDAQSVTEDIRKALGGLPIEEPRSTGPSSRLASDPYETVSERYNTVRQLIESEDFANVVETLQKAGLRGMGGAGFPAHLKWIAVQKAEGTPKFVVCNADESEPGSIKDRFIMTSMPHLLVEALIIAGLTVGAKCGWIYVRHEYSQALSLLKQEIEKCYRSNLLGQSILGSNLSFELEVFVSPGGYICGEGTAILEALEGKRAEPRDKPPQPSSRGLWNLPTLVHNVETLTACVTILARGPDWFKAQGMNNASGLKFVGLSGHVNRPGAYEVPFGITFEELIEKYGEGMLDGRSLLAFAPSGPSSGYLPAAYASTPLDWTPLANLDSTIGSSGVVICAEGTCMLDMALNAVRFFRNESCGKCVPCRIGTEKMTLMLEQWARGEFSAEQLPALADLSTMMRTASICGLGQVAPAPILSVLKHFPGVVENHVRHGKCPSGACFQN